MGKRLIQQARGSGGPTYRAPSFRYQGRAAHHPLNPQPLVGKIIDLITCQGHSAPLARVQYEDGKTCLLLAADGLRVGDVVTSGSNAAVERGNTLPLTQIPEGTLIYNIEQRPGDGGKFCRASGTFARVLSKAI
ncbi:50S ribosomal protein L2, partial [Candidatus Woesearchaeota archaeon]|nr:50S ribosomal protein L2 [Candidatus Woesearchaeota archaeon]